MQSPFRALLRRLTRRRNRRIMLRRLREMAAQDEARERVHAAWRREACDPEAIRIAARMVERAEMAVTV